MTKINLHKNSWTNREENWNVRFSQLSQYYLVLVWYVLVSACLLWRFTILRGFYSFMEYGTLIFISDTVHIRPNTGLLNVRIPLKYPVTVTLQWLRNLARICLWFRNIAIVSMFWCVSLQVADVLLFLECKMIVLSFSTTITWRKKCELELFNIWIWKRKLVRVHMCIFYVICFIYVLCACEFTFSMYICKFV